MSRMTIVSHAASQQAVPVSGMALRPSRVLIVRPAVSSQSHFSAASARF